MSEEQKGNKKKKGKMRTGGSVVKTKEKKRKEIKEGKHHMKLKCKFHCSPQVNTYSTRWERNIGLTLAMDHKMDSESEVTKWEHSSEC